MPRDPVATILADLRKALGVWDDVQAKELVGIVAKQGRMVDILLSRCVGPLCPELDHRFVSKYCNGGDADCASCWRAYLEAETGE